MKIARTSLLLIAWILFGCSPSAPVRNQIEISLDKEILPTGGRLAGIHNIFFSLPDDEGLRYPPQWDSVEVAKVASGKGFEPIYAIRYTDETGAVQHMIDTDADLNFTEERPLYFQAQDKRAIANVRVQIHPTSKSSATSYEIDYQIIKSEDGYTYARISEYRSARLDVNGQSYGVVLRPSSKDDPFFSLSPRTRLFIDQNQDGNLEEGWIVTEDGTVLATEEVDITKPFMLKGQPYVVSDLDSLGTRLLLETSDVEVAPAVDFTAPELGASGLDGTQHQLGDYRGKVVLLEFWSVYCSFCEHVRPQLNLLDEQYSSDEFAVLAIAKESDKEEIINHLNEHPKEATVLLYDESAWQEFNLLTATPTFYLIDRKGIIKLQGRGVSIIESLKVLVEELVNGE